MGLIFRQLGVVVVSAAAVAGAFGQAKKPARPAAGKPAVKKAAAAVPKPEPVQAADPADEKARFDAAIAAADPAEKAELLIKFIADHPRSAYKTRAQESLAGARAAIADEQLRRGETEKAMTLFRLAVEDSPKPYSDRFFNEIISTIPLNLFWAGGKTEAFEIARSIETHIAANPKQLTTLAGFYLGVENGTEAKRLAEAVIKLDEASAGGYQTLGMAQRLNFELEEAEKAFAKSVELDANSLSAKRMLAEMKRALGKADEAGALYQEILAKDENDLAAKTGYVLALFDAGKKAEAETELAKALEKTPGNVFLLSAAAYWYAANGDGVKAVELSRQAIEKEPRFIWSHIALARGQMAQGKPVDAEQTLVAARKYGNFPTLQYEIASARLAAGFYREAAEELEKSFAVSSEGVSTNLGGRVGRTSKDFNELISYRKKGQHLHARHGGHGRCGRPAAGPAYARENDGRGKTRRGRGT